MRLAVIRTKRLGLEVFAVRMGSSTLSVFLSKQQAMTYYNRILNKLKG